MPLFDRIGKRVLLTEAGKMFRVYALESINKANEGLLLLKDLNNLITGKIIIGEVYSMRIIFAKTLAIFEVLY